MGSKIEKVLKGCQRMCHQDRSSLSGVRTLRSSSDVAASHTGVRLLSAAQQTTPSLVMRTSNHFIVLPNPMGQEMVWGSKERSEVFLGNTQLAGMIWGQRLETPSLRPLAHRVGGQKAGLCRGGWAECPHMASPHGLGFSGQALGSEKERSNRGHSKRPHGSSWLKTSLQKSCNVTSIILIDWSSHKPAWLKGRKHRSS